MDAIIRNAKLRDSEGFFDIGIQGGIFAKIQKKIQESAPQEIDAHHHLVLPPFIESHVHLDSALTAGDPKFNESGTLLEGIDIWAKKKEMLTKKEIQENAFQTIQWLMANGVLKIRTHADSTEQDLKTLKVLLELKERLKDEIDIQVVAFPQDGIFTLNRGDQLLKEAVIMGADVIGGIPQVEFTREDGIRSIEYAFELAQKHDKLIDIHTDETGDPQSRFLEVIAKYTLEYGLQGKVSASHTTAMHNYDNDYTAKLIGLVQRAQVNIITNPFSNSLLQNKLDGYPRKRGHTRVDQLLEAGINVSIGNDNIMDPFNPVGKGSMLQAVHFLLHTGHLSGMKQISQLLDMITTNAGKTLYDKNYGIEIGNPADLIILDAKDDKEALRLQSECLYVIRRGKVLVETTPAKRALRIQDKNYWIDFKI